MEYEQTKSYGDDNKYTATDIAWLDGKLLITDEENNRVLLQDPETGEVEVKATAGNGPGEFLSPRGIDVSSDGMVYIVDAGNERVQVLDKKLNYKREVKLKDENKVRTLTSSILDVAVDSSGYMFVTSITTSNEKGAVYQIPPDYKAGDKLQTQDIDYGGSTCSDGEYIYTMNLSNNISGENYTSEISDVIQWKNGEIVERYRLPIRYAPGGFFVTDGMIYANRLVMRSVDKFDYVAGKSDIMYSIHQVPEDYKKWSVGFSGMCPDDKGNIYLIREDKTYSGETEVYKPGGYVVKLSPKKK